MTALRDGFVVDVDRWPTTISHRNGVPWWSAPMPRRLHRCSVQTAGWQGFHQVQRCACGAIRVTAGPWAWMNRNDRRKHARRRTAVAS